MAKTTIQMKLEKPAKSGGADRYAGQHEGDVVTFYIPQSISRETGSPAQQATVTIEV